jgi:hypothetical protein
MAFGQYRELTASRGEERIPFNDERSCSVLQEPGEGPVNLGVAARVQNVQLETKIARPAAARQRRLRHSCWWD